MCRGAIGSAPAVRAGRSGLAATLVHDAPAIAPEESAAARTSRAWAIARSRRTSSRGANCRSPRSSSALAALRRKADLKRTAPAPADFGADEANGRCVRSLGAYPARTIRARLRVAIRFGARVPSAEATSRLRPICRSVRSRRATVCRAVRERLGDPFSSAKNAFRCELFLRALAHRDFFLQLAWFHPETSE